MADLPSPPPATPAKDEPPAKNFAQWMFIGPNGLRAGWRLLVFVALFFASSRLIKLVIISVFHMPRPSAITWRFLLSGEGVGFACALFAAWVMSRIERRPMAIYGLPGSRAFRRNFWIGCLWGAGAVSALVLSIRAAHGLSFGGLALTNRAVLYYGTLWFAGFITVGLFEEFITRGYPQFTLATGIGFWPSAFVLSAFFGGAHLGNPGEEWTGAASAAFVGLWLAFTLRRTGDLWFAVGFHAVFDYGETFVYSVPNSGISFHGQLLHTAFHGPRWLTGGSVGPEGSVFAFILIAVLFVVFDRVYRRKATDFHR